MKKAWLAAALFMNAAVAGGANSSSVTVSWTATGDDGRVGTSAGYDLRYADHHISESNWSTATRVTNVPVPLPAGSVQSVTIDNLSDDLTYYFAIRAVDDAGNWSPVSNNSSWSNCSCIGMTGNVDGDPYDAVNISDLSDLISYLFLGQGSVACPVEANVDGSPDGNLTVSDLNVLISYLFKASADVSLMPVYCR